MHQSTLATARAARRAISPKPASAGASSQATVAMTWMLKAAPNSRVTSSPAPSQRQASTQSATDYQGRHLKIGTLTLSDIENYSNFKACGVNLSARFTSSSPSQARSTGSETFPNPTRWALHNQGESSGGAAAGVSHASGSARSTTHSSISPGH